MSVGGGPRTKEHWRSWAKTINRAQSSAVVVTSLESWPPLHGTVLSYLAMTDEVNIGPIHALARCRIAITRTPASGPLSVHEHHPNRLESHRLGFEQPTEDSPRIELDDIDVVLVPGLAFDARGNRLGWGRGYYDELLARLPAGVIRVGVTIDELLVDALPTEDHDRFCHFGGPILARSVDHPEPNGDGVGQWIAGGASRQRLCHRRRLAKIDDTGLMHKVGQRSVAIV